MNAATSLAVTAPRAIPAPRTRADLPRITDFYLPMGETSEQDDPRRAFCYYGTSSAADIAGSELESWTAGLYRAVREHDQSRRDFRVQYDGFAFRGRRDRSAAGIEVALRRLPQVTPFLRELNLRPAPMAELLLHPWLNRGGFVLFSALTGQGKSTTAAATIKERLVDHGGRCVTTEDPIELPLHGRWGPGSCGQYEVTYGNADPLDNGFAGGIRGALRKMPACKPAIIFVGEIRDAETAVEAIKAAVSGALLIATIHAETRVGALQRLVALAERDLGAAAPMLVGSALRLVIHQHLDLNSDASGWSRGTIRMDALFCGGERHPVAIAVREKRFQAIADMEQQQLNRLRLCAERGDSPSEMLRQFEIAP